MSGRGRIHRRAAALAAALALAGCSAAEKSEGPSAPPVTVQPVVALDVDDRIEATGELLARDHAEIAAEVAGRVTELLVEEGAPVRAGDSVVAIDPERRQLERDSAKARLDEMRDAQREQQREFERVATLHQRGVASQSQLDQAETAAKLARSRVAASEGELGVLERALRDALVAAPFDGLVVRRFVSRGEYVTPGTKLFELVALDPIEVEFHVPEIDSGRVASGQTVDVRVAPFPDESFEGTVAVVSPSIDPKSRTLRVKARLDNADGRLRPGLFARIDLGVSTREGVPMVVEEALLRRAEGTIAFRAQDGRVERIAVETGVHQGGYVEVVKGLGVGDLVVTRGGDRLIDGEAVVLRRPDGTLLSPPQPDVAGAPAEP